MSEDGWRPVAHRPGPIWQDMRPADIATLLNAFMGLIAILAAIRGDHTLAVHLIFAAIIVDGIDGAIARLGGGGGVLGATLDTLADVVTFVVAPAVVMILILGPSPLAVIGAFVFVTAGLLRLARFQTLGDMDHFLGLSTPGGAIVLGSALLLGPTEASMVGGALAGAALMLSTIPVPKLRGRIGVFGAGIIAVNLLIFALVPVISNLSLTIQLLATALYVVLGPGYVRKREAA